MSAQPHPCVDTPLPLSVPASSAGGAQRDAAKGAASPAPPLCGPPPAVCPQAELETQLQDAAKEAAGDSAAARRSAQLEAQVASLQREVNALRAQLRGQAEELVALQ
eukprot:157824-Chlamydomonas_euryale.AAC.2